MRASARVSARGVCWAAGLSLACLAAAGAARSDEPKSAAKARHWEGTLTVRPGVALRLVVHETTRPDGSKAYTLDSPDEGLEGLKLDPFTAEGGKVVFDLKLTKAHYEGTLSADEKEAVGTWSQRGASLPLTFRATEKPSPVPKIVGAESLWEGKIQLQAGLSLRFVIHVGKDASGHLMATADSPDQGAKGLKVDTISLDKQKLTFAMKRLAASYEGTLNAEGTEAKGTFTQGGVKMPLNLKRTEKVTEVKRPQTPKPPFPYRSVDVTYPNEAGGIKLAGTLTLPEGSGPFPAVILISGSGSQDRDETLFEHRPFAVLADTLTRRGVAVLRVDDRGVGGTTGDPKTSTTEDFAGDVQAGVDYLKRYKEIDPHRIGLMGHSEGGVIAPMVASRTGDVAFIVLLAGTGLPGDEIINLQSRAIALAMAGPGKGAELEKQFDIQKRLIEIARNEEDDQKAAARTKAVIAELKATLSEEEKKAAGDLDGLIDGQLKAIRGKWFRYFLRYDPRPALAKVKCPVLAVIGEKDLQVPPKENLGEIGKALEKGGNRHVTLKELPGLNHLFQTCTTGAPSEYPQIEETIAPAALKVIGDWVVEVSHAK